MSQPTSQELEFRTVTMCTGSRFTANTNDFEREKVDEEAGRSDKSLTFTPMHAWIGTLNICLGISCFSLSVNTAGVRCV